MNIWFISLAAGVFVLFVLYIPEIFPKCGSCEKIKPRFLFRVHKTVGINPGYRGNCSVCRRCCKKYGITGPIDLVRLQQIRKQVKLKSVYRDPLE